MVALPKHPWIAITLLRTQAMAAWSPENNEVVLPSETKEEIALPLPQTYDGSGSSQIAFSVILPLS